MTRLAIAAAALLGLAPARARAESWYVHHAALEADGEAIGDLYGARVAPVGWADDARPRVAYSDEAIAMQVEIRLAEPETHVSVGVGRAARVRTSSPFRIEMRALSWAPLLGRDAPGVRIALPPGLPASEGVLVAAADAPARARPPDVAFGHLPAPDVFVPACGRPILRTRPDPRAPAWTVDGERAAIALGPERDGFTRARVLVDGFVVYGWLEGAMPSCEGVIHLGGVGSACGDGAGHGVVVTLPAGTELYASRTAARPFARLRRDELGIEPRDFPRAQACAGGRCELVPPEPRGPAAWILHAHVGDGGWVLTAWVRTPAETLARPPDGSSGFGMCWSPPTDWPRP